MHIILKTYQANEHAEGCEYAFLDLDAALAAKIKERSELFQRCHETDPSLTAMDFWDCSPVFLETYPGEGEDDPEAVALNETRDAPATKDWVETHYYVEDCENIAERTDVDRMVIGATDVYWSCYPKHCNWTVETREIAYTDVFKVLETVPA